MWGLVIEGLKPKGNNSEVKGLGRALPGSVLVSVSVSVFCSTNVVVNVVPGARDTEVTVTSTVEVLNRTMISIDHSDEHR